jgi:catechol 2,3-dioxygenase-like lactoylglutathione lyase family enzyme
MFGLTVVTLGVRSVADSAAFYGRLGFKRRMRTTGDEVAFFDAGNLIVSLYRWDRLAADAGLADQPRPPAFRGITLACNCETDDEVDAILKHALGAGASLVKAAHTTDYGGYSGYFADPDGHPWEVVRAPGMTFDADGRLVLPD